MPLIIASGAWSASRRITTPLTMTSRFLPLLLFLLLMTTTRSKAQTAPQHGACNLLPPLAQKGIGYRPYYSHWEQGIVPYYFDFPESDEGGRLREVMEEAIAIMNETTDVCWIHAYEERRGVRIFRSAEDYNYATLGRKGGGRDRLAMISKNVGIGLHEMSHVLGILHEQQRPDRDEYITIAQSNIKSGFAHNFAKVEHRFSNYYLMATPYDLESVMHYGPYAFSRNRRPTITTRWGQTEGFGFRKNLSPLDIVQINAMHPDAISQRACDSIVRSRTVQLSFSVQGAGVTEGNCPNRETLLTAIPIGGDQRNLRYSWHAEAGYPRSASGEEYRVTFDRPGSYPVVMKAYRRDRLIATHESTVEITQAADDIQLLGNPVVAGSPLHYRVMANQQDFGLQLIDVSGRRVFTKEHAAADCAVEDFIPTAGLAAGVYWLMYVRGKETFGKKVVIL